MVMSHELPSAEPPITLEQLAGISAALAEKLALSDVLAQEQVAEAAFRAAQPIWRQRIADSMETQLAYMEKLRVAEDCLARKLTPIEDDAAAWVGLLAAMATSLDQAEWMRQLGITMTDVGRLGRLWKRRMQADPAVAAQLAELAKNPQPLAGVAAEPIELRPFPWTPKAPAPKAAPDRAELDESAGPLSPARPVARVLASFQKVKGSSSELQVIETSNAATGGGQTWSFDSWTIKHYAVLARALRSRPAEADEVMERAGLLTPQSRQLLHEHFRRRFENEPGLREAFSALLASPTTPAAAAMGEGGDPLGDTIPAHRGLKATMPFMKAAKPTSDKAPVSRREKKGTQRATSSTPSLLADEGPATLASQLPLTEDTDSSAPTNRHPRPGPASPGERPSEPPAEHDLGTTRASEPDRARPGPTLPFAKPKGGKPAESESTTDDPELTRFAQLTFALASEDDRAAVLLRFKLTEAGRRALSEEWGDRMAADGALRKRFVEIIRWLKSNPPGDR